MTVKVHPVAVTRNNCRHIKESDRSQRARLQEIPTSSLRGTFTKSPPGDFFFGAAFPQTAGLLEYAGSADVGQAARMSERANALEAGRAVQGWMVVGVIAKPQYAGLDVQWRCVLWAAGAEDRYLTDAKGRSHVHQTRIVADHDLCAGDQAQGLHQ